VRNIFAQVVVAELGLGTFLWRILTSMLRAFHRHLPSLSLPELRCIVGCMWLLLWTAVRTVWAQNVRWKLLRKM